MGLVAKGTNLVFGGLEFSSEGKMVCVGGWALSSAAINLISHALIIQPPLKTPKRLDFGLLLG